MSTIIDEIRFAVLGRHPLLYLKTPEEGRVVAALEVLAKELGKGTSVTTWTCVDGLGPNIDPATTDPAAALKAIVQKPRKGFYVMKDLSEFMDDRRVVRALRDAYRALLEKGGTSIVIVSPVMKLPEMLEKEICLVEIDLPPAADLIAQALAVQKEYPGLEIPKAMHSQIALTLRGLTLDEAAHVMHRVFEAGSMEPGDILDEIFREKKMLMRKAGFLEFIPTRLTLTDIGGMEILKEWAEKRTNLFTQDAVDKGLPVPKGILIMGISGCGKSLACKAIAGLWKVPLFRLDMNLVFSGLYGTPEAAFHKALKTIESVAPAVLWIDEIENALGMTTEDVTPEQSLTFSSFLTWMQERPPLVFVSATANRIESLPAEIIRKGRFDQVFFCDLPNERERREIILVHLKANEIAPESIELDKFIFSTQGWSGAEIEQAIISARIDAHQEGKPVSLEHIRYHTTRMVPLSTTMAEQIKAIRNWSYQRATRASREGKRSMLPSEQG